MGFKRGGKQGKSKKKRGKKPGKRVSNQEARAGYNVKQYMKKRKQKNVVLSPGI